MVSKSKTIPGINIQWPWSDHIVQGRKTIETRTYQMPAKFKGVEMAIIETPGPYGRKLGIKKARIVGTVIFSDCIQYNRSTWSRDYNKHLVDTKDSQFAWDPEVPRWGWIIQKVRKFKEPKPAPAKKGIVFASACKI